MQREKVKNFMVGATTFAILSLILIFGLGIFFPKPQDLRLNYDYRSCATGDQACFIRQNEEIERIRNDYNVARDDYDEKIFMYSSGAGLLILLVGFFLFRTRFEVHVTSGIIFAGAFAIFYGYFQGPLFK